MNTNTKNYQLDSELTLHHFSQSSLTVQAIALTITTQNDHLIDAHLTLVVNPQLYQRIDTSALFNLQPALRGALTNGEFDSETNIEITASLKFELLPNLTPYLDNPPAYLQKLSQEEPNNPLLSTDNWLGLEVKQQRLPLETGYRTFWDYLSSAAVTNNKVDSEQINNAIINFFQDWAAANLQSKTNEVISQALSEVTQGLEEWLDTSISAMTSETLTQTISEIANAFEKLADASELEINQQNVASQDIFEAMVNFFITDDWPYRKIENEPILRTAFSGKNGTWNCYALARLKQQQLVFYSVYPTSAPENKRLAVAEFITRANSGMIVGNFELNFEQGEIRYKTSIDVADDQISFNCIKNLVYTNVTMMDKYLPGIISVINGNAPISAINQIELIQSPAPSSDDDEQILAIAPHNQEELAVNQSSQIDLQQQEKRHDREAHILAILTPEEITQFHEALQMLAPYQRKQAQAKTEKIKNKILLRLGDLGTQIYSQATTFFLEIKLAPKNLKLIQRYSGLAGRTKLLVQYLSQWSQQYGEVLVNSEVSTALVELEDLFWCVEERLQTLPTDKIEGKQEVQILTEIEEFREQLAFYEKLIKIS